MYIPINVVFIYNRLIFHFIHSITTLAGRYIEMYNSYFVLAVYFQRTNEDDKWLSDYFFELTLEASSHIEEDGGRRYAEAHSNVGQSFKASGRSCIYYFVYIGIIYY